MNRIVWLDGVKGFSILCVMMCHSCGFPFGTTPYFLSGFVSVFFVASGFTFRDSTFSNGIVKKAKSLLIPYFFYGFICISALSLRWFYLNNYDLNYTFEKIEGLMYSRFCLYNSNYEELYYSNDNIFFLKNGLEPFWFLTCMFLAYFWTYLYFFISKRKLGGAIIIVYLLLAYGGSFLPILLPWSFDASFIAAFFIICGCHLKSYFFPKIKFWTLSDNNKIKVTRCLVLVFSITVFIICTIVFGYGNFSLSDYGRYGILGFLSFCLMGVIKTYLLSVFMGSKMEKTLLVKFFAFIGRHSLRLMCVHLAVFVFLDCVSSGNYFLSFAGMTISLLLSIAFGYFTGKDFCVPFLRYV